MHLVSPLLAKLTLTFYYSKSYIRMLYVKVRVKSRTAGRRPSRRRPCSPPSAADTAASAEWRYPAQSRAHGQWETGEQGTHPPLEVLALLGVVTHVPTIRPGGN